jgi:DNA-binding transcriptional ArsR family regulator
MRRDTFQAIADPTRRAIICFIANDAMTPNTLADQFDISRQAVSKHIRVLDECGLLITRQIGRERYYQAQSDKLKEIDDWLQPFRKLWEDRFENLDKVLKTLK